MERIASLLKVLIPILLLTFNSCDYMPGAADEDVVAEAMGEKLYTSDLQGIIPEGISANDSINLIRRYIDNWIRQQIFLEHAKKSLSPEQMDFEKKIRDYSNSLTIFAFENNYIQKNLDTIVEENQIKEYYEKHKEEFKLKDIIVKVTYVKVPRNAPDQNLLRRLYRSTDPEDMASLEDYCTQHAAAFYTDIDSWLLFNEILREIPIQASNRGAFLRNNQNVEISDDYYRYFLYIHDYRLKDNISPVGFVTENIKNIILNRRKQELINKLRNDLYRDAVKSNSFEVFI